ncbi:MAG: aldehyde dehydrogenase family protein [Candidatus Binatia bacterium]
MYTFDSVYHHFINGEWVPSTSGDTFETYNPATQEVLARVQSGNAEDVDRAVRAAQSAAPGWGCTPPRERAAILLEIADRLERKCREFSEAECLNNGRPLREILAIDLPLTIDQFGYFAAAAQILEGNAVEVAGGMRYTLHEPIGVVGQIIPWNVPLLMVALKLGPALGAGNTVVLKPAEQTPLSLLEVVKEIQDLLPRGVLNVVTGFGPTAGAPLAQHPAVRRIAFTGETSTGRLILQYASANIVPTTLELGGKGPGIIFPDCDIEKAVEGTIMGFCAFNGQQCLSASRLFLHADIEKPFLDRLLRKVREIRIGDPLDMETQLGAVISREQFDKVLRYIEIGKQEGATLVCGGEPASVSGFPNGLFIVPAIFQGVRNDMRIAQEEIFGPVLSVLTWRDREQMLAEANGVSYGLTASIWTRDVVVAHQTARALQFGTVWINRFANTPSGAPVGGYKKSGIGREMAFETLRAYTQTKSVLIDFGREPLGFY